MEERKRQVKAVRDGYASSKVFEHTIKDVVEAFKRE